MAHMGMIHRACKRLSDETEETPWRPMLKFIFNASPEHADQIKGGVPSWNHHPSLVQPWAELTTEPALIPAMKSQFEYLLSGRGGTYAPLGGALADSAEHVPALKAALMAEPRLADEAERVSAA